QEAEQQHDGGGEYGSKRDRDPGDSGTPERALESTEHLKYRKSARAESEQHRGNSEHGADDYREPQQSGNQGASEFDGLRAQAEVRGNGAARRLVGDERLREQRVDENDREISRSKHYDSDDQPFGEETRKPNVAGNERAEDERRGDPADCHDAR